MQKRDPYTENLNSGMSGDSKNVFLHRGDVLDCSDAACRQPCTLYLCLQGVEVGEGVHGLVGGVVQGRQGEGVQVQQLSVGWVPLWQDQILERHC